MTQTHDVATGWPAEPPDDTHSARAAPGGNGGRHAPPHNLDAEKAVLGACLQGNLATIADVRAILPTSDLFYNPRHGVIWRAIVSLADEGVTPDPITVPARVKHLGDRWGETEDRLYLLDLYGNAPVHMQGTYWAQEIAGHAARRQAIEFGIRLQQLGETGTTEAIANLLPQFRAKIDQLAAGLPTDKPHLEFLRVSELADRVAAAGPRRWLMRGLWPAGDYGVHAAEFKAQKTWNTVDLAVSVATGTPWLGHVPIDDPGAVLMLAGEGGEADLYRRIHAVAQGTSVRDLDITLCTRAPHLANPAHLRELEAQLDKVRPKLVTLDPLYLAARGAQLSNLYEMGATLEAVQHLCQAAGASLWVVTHFNRKEGKGASRMTGAGPAEWGRVLVSATVVSRSKDPLSGETTVLTEMDWIGGSIADSKMRIVRRIRAEDPDDLDSDLHYSVTVEMDEETSEIVTPANVNRDDWPPARRKTFEALEALGKPVTQREMVEKMNEMHGHRLKRETASRELNALFDTGVVTKFEHAAGREHMWAVAGLVDPQDPLA